MFCSASQSFTPAPLKRQMFVLCWVAADVLSKIRASLIKGVRVGSPHSASSCCQAICSVGRGEEAGGGGGLGEEDQKCIALEDSVKDRYKVRRAFQYIFIYLRNSVFAHLEK